MSCFVTRTDTTALPLTALTTAALPGWIAGQPAHVAAWIEAAGFRAEPATTLLLPGADGAPQRALVGIGDAGDPLALGHAPLSLPPGTYRLDGDGRLDARAALLGWGLGAYQFDRYRKPARAPARLQVDAAALAAVQPTLDAVYRVRDLVNTPSEDMGPEQLEAAVRDIAQRFGAEVESIVGDALIERGFPTIHAVGRASPRAPRLIALRWGDASHPALTLVGKGVCFDTGGLNLKSGDGMRWMKKDMGGAAHAIALAQLVMAHALPVRLTLLVAAVDNAVSGNAYRPGEVLRTRAGISVEVDNTDAEGRLVLCDALAYAAETPPELMIDFATLTGAARVALGPDLPAMYSNRDDVRGAVFDCAVAERDPVWPMPLWQPYQVYLKSYLADMANSGSSRMAGSITAALFLERFVPAALPWVHFDTYAWNDGDRPGRPMGGEAQGLRAAFAYLQRRFGAAG